jgi:NADPH:quinone reductase-like Zn-dependent oxidoreductase
VAAIRRPDQETGDCVHAVFQVLSPLNNPVERCSDVVRERPLNLYAILGEALSTLAPGGSLTTLGYAAGRDATIDVTNLIWKGASIMSFMLFAQPPAAFAEAWRTLTRLIQSGAIKPIVAKTFPLADAAAALRYLTEDRPFGRVVLTI